MLVWFTVLAVLGLGHILDSPRVLEAVNPVHAVDFFVDGRVGGLPRPRLGLPGGDRR